MVNDVGLERYLYGVAPAEIPPSWPAESPALAGGRRPLLRAHQPPAGRARSTCTPAPLPGLPRRLRRDGPHHRRGARHRRGRADGPHERRAHVLPLLLRRPHRCGRRGLRPTCARSTTPTTASRRTTTAPSKLTDAEAARRLAPVPAGDLVDVARHRPHGQRTGGDGAHHRHAGHRRYTGHDRPLPARPALGLVQRGGFVIPAAVLTSSLGRRSVRMVRS